MIHNNPFLRFMAENDIAKSMQQYRENAMDWQSLFEMQRRNAHAWSQAGKVTMGNLQNIANQQRQMVSQMAKENASMGKNIMQKDTTEERMEQNIEIIKNWTETTAQNMHTVSKLLNKSQEEAGEIINKRMIESVEEFKSSMSSKKTGKAA